MKLIIVALAFVAVVAAAPSSIDSNPIGIVSSNYDQSPDGPYSFNYETENGIKRKEVGELKVALDEENKPHPVVTVRGSFSYIDSNGKTETIEYFADETGFHAEGDSVPKPPAPSSR